VTDETNNTKDVIITYQYILLNKKINRKPKNATFNILLYFREKKTYWLKDIQIYYLPFFAQNDN